MKQLLLLLFFTITLFSKEITVWGEDRAVTKIEARKKALENAQAVASAQINTKVKTSYTEIQKEINNKLSSTISISQNFQVSNATLEVIEVLKEEIEESPYSKNFGSITQVRVQVKFKVIEGVKKRIAIKKKKNLPKVVPTKNEPLKFNFQANSSYNGINKYLKKLPKSLMIIPKEKFKKIKNWKLQFARTSKFYKNITQYIYPFKNNSLSLKLSKGNYITLLLVGNDFFLVEKLDGKAHFKNITIQNKPIKKRFTLFEKSFSLFWNPKHLKQVKICC